MGSFLIHQKLKYSFIAFISGAVILICSGFFFYPRWQQSRGEAQISWDASGYYWYLPSVFIYHDLKGQQFKDSIMQKYEPVPANDFQQGIRQPSGNYVLKYTMGIALLEVPAFAVAHISAGPLGYPADGFSRPYQFMVFAGAILFVLTGLFYLRKLLLFYYSDRVVAIVLLILCFGTNYLNYSAIDVGMAHCWLFSLYVFILLNTHYYYETLKSRYILRTGLLIGLATLVRPTEFISVFILLFWGMERFTAKALKERFLFIKKQFGQFFAAGILTALVISLQLIYWKYATGSWLVYTYQESFSWLSPHFGQYAFNYQCGWLVYTPVMIFSVLGIIPFIKNGRNKVAILTVILVNYYIVASWDGWIYGGRAMVQGYALLVFPLASFIRLMCSRSILVWIGSPALLLLSYVNIWWTYQAHKGGLTGGRPTTRNYFWATVLRYNVPLEVQKLRDNHHNYTEAIRSFDVIYTNDLSNDGPGGALELKKDASESKEYFFPKPAKDYQWLRASADIHINEKEDNVGFMTHFVIQLRKGLTIIQSNGIRLQRLMEPNSTKNIYIDTRISDQDYDRIEILFFNENNGPKPCVIDNLKVIGFND